MKPNDTARLRVSHKLTNKLYPERDEPCRITPKRITVGNHQFDRATLQCLDADRGTYNYQLLSFEVHP